MKAESIKQGSLVYWIEYSEDIAYVFEGEYIATIDNACSIDEQSLVRDGRGRNVQVKNVFTRREEVLEKAYLHNELIAKTNRLRNEEFKELREKYWKLQDRVEKLEKKKFKLF